LRVRLYIQDAISDFFDLC